MPRYLASQAPQSLLRWVLIGLALAVVSGSARPSAAAAISFAIDLDISESISDAVPVGEYRQAGVFRFDERLLNGPSGTPNVLSVVTWDQVGPFRLDLANLSLTSDHLRAGQCIASGVLPGCGMLFAGTSYLGVVGQFSIPNALVAPTFNFRLDNTSPTLFSPESIFQSVSIEDLDLGFTVAGGPLAVRPIPEPSSVLALLLGAAVVGFAFKNSRTQGRARSLTRTPGASHAPDPGDAHTAARV